MIDGNFRRVLIVQRNWEQPLAKEHPWECPTCFPIQVGQLCVDELFFCLALVWALIHDHGDETFFSSLTSNEALACILRVGRVVLDIGRYTFQRVVVTHLLIDQQNDEVFAILLQKEALLPKINHTIRLVYGFVVYDHLLWDLFYHEEIDWLDDVMKRYQNILQYSMNR